MSNDSNVGQFLADYYRVFSTLDLNAIQTYFHRPAVFIGPAGVFPLDAGTLIAMMTRTIDDLRAKDYGHSEFILQHEKPLGSQSAFVSGIALRFKTDGQELERVPLSYILQKAESGWKIAVLLLHAA